MYQNCSLFRSWLNIKKTQWDINKAGCIAHIVFYVIRSGNDTRRRETCFTESLFFSKTVHRFAFIPSEIWQSCQRMKSNQYWIKQTQSQHYNNDAVSGTSNHSVRKQNRMCLLHTLELGDWYIRLPWSHCEPTLHFFHSHAMHVNVTTQFVDQNEKDGYLLKQLSSDVHEKVYFYFVIIHDEHLNAENRRRVHDSHCKELRLDSFLCETSVIASCNRLHSFRRSIIEMILRACLLWQSWRNMGATEQKELIFKCFFQGIGQYWGTSSFRMDLFTSNTPVYGPFWTRRTVDT